MTQTYDVVVVGGGPAGATMAEDMARRGHKVALLDRAGRIKPCGGAIPPRLVRDFAIPEHLLFAQDLLDHVVVLLRPITRAAQAPDVDDIADEIEGVRLDLAQESAGWHRRWCRGCPRCRSEIQAVR